MSTTIFCNFEQRDMADLAMGRLRASSLEVHSISYLGGFKPESEYNALAGAAAFGLAGTMDTQTQEPAPALGFTTTNDYQMPSRPVTVKIVCSDSSAAAVKSKLINMNAYQIITTR